MRKSKTHRVSPPIRLLACGLCLVAFAALSLSSCNVTRTITTTSSAYQKGDTCVQIVSKTTEVYDATKKSNLPL